MCQVDCGVRDNIIGVKFTLTVCLALIGLQIIVSLDAYCSNPFFAVANINDSIVKITEKDSVTDISYVRKLKNSTVESDVQAVINKIIERYSDIVSNDEDIDIDIYADLISERLQYLADNPLNINTASKEDIEQLFVLSDFQIESILDYRKEHGDIWSLTELELINGFDNEISEYLKCFVTFDIGENRMKYRRTMQELYFKGNRVIERQEWYKPISSKEYEKSPNSRYVGSPYYLLLKYKLNLHDKIKIGFVTEKDAGEYMTFKKPADFFSGHIAFNGLKLLKNTKTDIVIGDYSVRFGQGLTIWNSFNMAGVQNPMGFYKRGAHIIPYGSSNESNYLRGFAVAINSKTVDFSFFASYKGVDATIKWMDEDQEYKYTAIQNTGIHNTVSTLKNKNSMHEKAFGASAVCIIYDGKIKTGINWVTQSYSKKCGKTVREDNKYQIYDGYCGSVSMDFYTNLGRCGVFGEAAIDYNSTFSGLVGTRIPITDKCEAGVLLWRYSKKYIAPLSGAYSSSSNGCNNQEGAALNAIYYLSRIWKLTISASAIHYPWKKYNIDEPSSVYKGLARIDYTDELWNVYVRITEKYSNYDKINLLKFKWMAQYKVLRAIAFKVQNEYIYTERMLGISVAGDISYSSLNGAVKFQTRFSLFKCDSWDIRLYMYENDLPQSFTSQLYYGKGLKAYALMQLRLCRYADIYLKLDTLRYARDIAKSDSESDTESVKQPVSKIKLGVRIKL